MATISRLLLLPAELQDEIIAYLGFPDNVYLKNSCRQFNVTIPALNHEQLLSAELTEFASIKHIYTCQYCLRLRSAHRFSDPMMKAKKRRGGGDASKRFCVDCGIQSGPGITRYTRGDRITIRGEAFVICIRCNRYSTAPSEDKTARDCLCCWSRSRQVRGAKKKAEENARRRIGHECRREKYRELLNSDSEDNYSNGSDDAPVFGTAGWDAYHLALAQSDTFGDCASDFY